VCWQVGSLDEALAAVDAGADIVVVQGTEAGGHVRGYAELLPLLTSVVGKVRVPVLASGGIADARSFRRVLEAGAAGARIGTRFVATDESGAHPDYKAAVVAAGEGSTEITDAFDACPLCATVPRARVLRSCVHALALLEGDVVGSTVWGPKTITVPRGFGLPPGMATTGHFEAMAMYCGEWASLIHDVVPAATVISRLLG